MLLNMKMIRDAHSVSGIPTTGNARTTIEKSNVLINNTNSLTQLCLGSKAKMNQYLQKLLRTEKELEVATNSNTVPNYSEKR